MEMRRSLKKRSAARVAGEFFTPNIWTFNIRRSLTFALIRAALRCEVRVRPPPSRTGPNQFDEHCTRLVCVSYFARKRDAPSVYTVAGFQAEMETQAVDGGH